MDTTQRQIGPLQIGIILLTSATAIIHIVVAIPETLILFYLNGIGYLALAAGLYLPQFKNYQNTTRWILIIFTAITVFSWVVIGQRILIAYLDKLIEIALIISLWVERR